MARDLPRSDDAARRGTQYPGDVRAGERSAAERLRDSRSRRFAEIESAIIAEERAIRRLVWEIPRYDVRVRLLAAQRITHRREHLAESARLSEARRSATEPDTDPLADPD